MTFEEINAVACKAAGIKMNPPPAAGTTIYCSQCGSEFTGDGKLYGYSHCSDHRRADAAVEYRDAINHAAVAAMRANQCMEHLRDNKPGIARSDALYSAFFALKTLAELTGDSRLEFYGLWERIRELVEEKTGRPA